MKVILGHKNDDITTHYSQEEIQELKDAAKLLTNLRKAIPALKLVGKVLEYTFVGAHGLMKVEVVITIHKE